MLPSDYPAIFGQNFATRNTVPIIVIGRRSYTKYDLGRLGCPHTNAAHNLHRVLQQLGAKSLEDVVTRFSPEDFVGIKGFRTTGFYALTCLLRDAQLPVKGFYKAKITVDTLADKARAVRRRHRRRAA